MTLGNILTSIRKTDHKVTIGFYSTVVLCLLLLFVLYFTPGGRLLPGLLPFVECEVPESPSSSSQQELTSGSILVKEGIAFKGTSGETQQRQPQVQVLEEWRLPEVAEDRPIEKLEGPEAFGEPRRFLPLGSGSFLFVQFGAYRTGPNAFAVVGLGTKGLHVFGNPGFECAWVSNGEGNSSVNGTTTKHLPDWGLGNQYSVIVVHCYFGSEVGIDGSGGRLEFVANHGEKDHTGIPDVHWVAVTEEAKQYNQSSFLAPYKYDYLYCGSPLFGSISPERMREWIAYHVWLFGPRSHFVLYDAGGIHPDVQKVLQPWINLGFVSVMNIRQQARYDSYYFGQFLVNNDCMFKGKTWANWTFFFDLDEYIKVLAPFTFDEVMMSYTQMGRKAQQVHFQQNFFSNHYCRRNDSLNSTALESQWMFEKLVYRRTAHTKKWGYNNKKYALQAQYALATGVHNSRDTMNPKYEGLKGTTFTDLTKMTYNHYHHTVDKRTEICQEFVDPKLTTAQLTTESNGGDEADVSSHELDLTMAILGDAIREFENRSIGQQPFLL